MTSVLIRRRSYGALLFEQCEAATLDFFTRDASSTNGRLSYDDRAMSEPPDAFDDIDVAVIRGGMGLNRHPKTGWQWLLNESPVDLVTALPGDLHLGDVPDHDYVELRQQIEEALRGFVGDTGARRGLATATKMLHVKRPALIPICDSYTIAMLGIALKADAGKDERVEAGLIACDLVREAARNNGNALALICAHLAEERLDRTPVRVLDVPLWLAYGGNIRECRPRVD